MECDFKLKRRLRTHNLNSWRKLKRLELLLKKLRPTLEFYLYEDFPENNPKYTYYRLDIMGKSRLLLSRANKSFLLLVEDLFYLFRGFSNEI